MDARLCGFWQVLSVDMVSDRLVNLVAGLPGEIVEFAASGRYINWGQPGEADPHRYVLRWFDTEPPGLDIGLPGFPKSHCIYAIAGDELCLCMAGDHLPRPTEIRRDDERLWCVKTYKRWVGEVPVEPTRRRK